MADRVTITLTDLHCEAQSEAGGCEPYLFTSFYSISGDQVDVETPAHHDVRGAFANDVEAGQTLPVPQEIGTASVNAAAGARIGVVALVIDEDLGRDVAVEKAHKAFHAEVENQLRSCGDRIDADTLREAVLSKVRGAVHGTFDYSDLHRDQDDHLGLGVQEISGAGEFEVQLGFDDDRFILRGRADHA
ncbi:hypothetical protein M8312_02630 [Sphingomonas sp. KRR8]|jgi:hypothetical protein|uniref:hypothetical protein n=1 Tax=Sphingomonas sp. KRR8 TaxID=2942996 RepID=UPI0020225613|nr:hypothetical protein [Sphingomonas sp. KRR8]URD61429.1 hypothetical protein M8312_02630 [Sphingomonas sp. KRR8]